MRVISPKRLMESVFPTVSRNGGIFNTSSLDLQFARTKTLDPRITFTRASSGTYVGSDGLIKTATTNEARFDHNPTTGESLGLLVEEARTNLALHSRDLTNAAWVVSSVTAAKNQTGADGVSNSASSITAFAGNGTILQTITSASAARATSAYVKRITGTGTIEMTQDNGTTWTAVTVTSAWTRVTIPSATVTNPVVGFRIVTSGDAIAVDYVQCESGAFSTSAIATTSATVTRSADVASITGANFSSWYRQDEGTVFAKEGLNRTFDATRLSLEFGDGTNANRLNHGVNPVGSASASVVSAATTQASFASANAFLAGTANSSFAYRLNDFAFVVNGGTPLVDTSGTVPTVSTLYIGKIGSTASSNTMWCGTIARLTYWPQRLPNSTLQSITT